MQIKLLGTVEATGTPLHGLRLRGLLARLALDAGRPVAPSVLVDALWDDPPENAGNALQALVSRLRRALGGAAVATGPGGYRLTVDPGEIDAVAFERLVRDAATAATASSADAHAQLGEALALWRGPALADLVELPFARPAAARLDELRAVALEDRARAALRLGLPPDVEALTAQLDEAPLREPTAALLGRALHATGRQAEALAVLDRTTARLADELGVDPGSDLAAARMHVLRPGAAPRAGLTSFVGRAVDVVRIRDLLATGRLVTLVGPGGAGKTRLAREALGDAAVVAELAALTDAGQLAPAVLAAVGEPDLITGHREELGDVATRLRTTLEHRDALLLLDNCEHLVGAVAFLIGGLLDDCSRLRVLATSREPLNVPGEVLHPVEALAEVDAMRLFADRGAAVRPGFALDGDRGAVAEICRRLDGQPLPIELAAARLRTLTVTEIAGRLDDRFRLLTSGARTALPRHQTLRAVVDWSWDLLDEAERAVARRLGVFAGGATLAAAERVCGPDAFEPLASLVDKSLVVAVPQAEGSTRYRMLETIRAYAGERLDEAGERHEAEAAHSAFVLDLVERAEPHLRGREQLRWLARLRAEDEEIDAALRRSVPADPPLAHRLVVALGWSWLIRGRVEDGRRWFAALPAAGADVPAADRALAAVFRAIVVVTAGDVATARAHAETALAELPALRRPWHPLLELAEPVYRTFTARDQDPLRQLVATTGDPWVRAMALLTLAARAENDGAVDEQRRLARTAHEALRAVGDRFGLGMVIYSLGELESLAGDHAAAAAAWDEAVALATELGNDGELLQYIAARAVLEARRGDLPAARRLLAGAAALPDRWPAGPGGAVVASALADIERRAGDLGAARAQLAVVDAAAAADPHALGLPQRRAYLSLQHALVDLAACDLATARTAVRAAVTDGLAGRDGPVVALVAEVAALLAHAEGDDRGAVALLAVAVDQRGMLDRGSPEVAALLAALGPDVDDAIARARADGGSNADRGPDGEGKARRLAGLVAFAAREPAHPTGRKPLPDRG